MKLVLCFCGTVAEFAPSQNELSFRETAHLACELKEAKEVLKKCAPIIRAVAKLYTNEEYRRINWGSYTAYDAEILAAREIKPQIAAALRPKKPVFRHVENVVIGGNEFLRLEAE